MLDSLEPGHNRDGDSQIPHSRPIPISSPITSSRSQGNPPGIGHQGNQEGELLEPGEKTTRVSSSDRHLVTTFFVSNLHCPSCVRTIRNALGELKPTPEVAVSIVLHTVTVTHSTDITTDLLFSVFQREGFDVHTVFQKADVEHPERLVYSSSTPEENWEKSLESAVARWKPRSWLKNTQDLHSTKTTQTSRPPRTRDFSSSNSHPALPSIPESDMGKLGLAHSDNCEECRKELSWPPARPRKSGSPHSRQEKHKAITELFSATPTSPQSEALPFSLEELPANLRKETISSQSKRSQESTIGSDQRKALSYLTHYKGAYIISGMTCSSCTGAVTADLEKLPYVSTVEVSLLTNSATVVFVGDNGKRIAEVISDAGYPAELVSVETLPSETTSRKQSGEVLATPRWKATFEIGGMTCASCVGTVTSAIERVESVEQVDINLLSHSGTVIFRDKEHIQDILDAITNSGYDTTLAGLVDINAEQADEAGEREIFVQVNGMYCRHCPDKIKSQLQSSFGSSISFIDDKSVEESIFRLRYVPRPPELTVRKILQVIESVDPNFKASIHHPPTIEDRARTVSARERRSILLRLALSVAAAIPTFIIVIVFETLLPAHHPLREYVLHPMWSGQVSRSAWAQFFIATPVYFLAADIFHRKTISELRALWRRGNSTPLYRRLTRFGSMNMLLSFGTTIAYFGSIAELILAANQPRDEMKDGMGGRMYYFDAVVFLCMFILMGRFIEAYSKAKSGDAVTKLSQLRPSDAILMDDGHPNGASIPVDHLDTGDVVRVPVGSSPPFDGIIVQGSTTFDESSLTGESLPVTKKVGDEIYSGTVNKSSPVLARLTKTQGSSMLDQIIKVVREGQTRRAPVEKIADTITSHFVPIVIVIALFTWFLWLGLGLGGVLPDSYMDSKVGGYPVWSLRFAIAVFVIACPCGIGLAAPTALFVGGGLAAQSGILAKGGGEAFQLASSLDAVIFDKTGTLTEGGDPQVASHQILLERYNQLICHLVSKVEGESGHVVAKAVSRHCQSLLTTFTPELEVVRRAYSVPVTIQEIAGKGMYAHFNGGTEGPEVEVIIGNDRLMKDHSVTISPDQEELLMKWKSLGQSVVIAAIKRVSSSPTSVQFDVPVGSYHPAAMYAIADTIRPEAFSIVSKLQKRGITVWMVSGDNLTTAKAVAKLVGIPETNVFAHVLPDEKAEKVQIIRKITSAAKNSGSSSSTLDQDAEFGDVPRRNHGRKKFKSARVAMVGDGINDSPALTAADVGIAIGSGSDVALSSADFILIQSRLDSILILIDLSKKVFRRVWFNFGWAFLYNVLAMPVAAGAFYPIRTGSGTHVRLDPVWASLAMACSSLSVVFSSLLLRSKIPGLGFRQSVSEHNRQQRPTDTSVSQTA